MSDLQCPATFVLVPADAEATALARSLATARVAEVVSGWPPASVELASRLAATWGLPGPVESALDLLTYREVLAALADLRRGETTVVVVDPELLDVAAGRGGAEGRTTRLEVLVDADGWVVRDGGGPVSGAAGG